VNADGATVYTPPSSTTPTKTIDKTIADKTTSSTSSAVKQPQAIAATATVKQVRHTTVVRSSYCQCHLAFMRFDILYHHCRTCASTLSYCITNLRICNVLYTLYTNTNTGRCACKHC
jgi:hypothetical protein